MALQQARRRLTAGLLQGWGARSAVACCSGAEAAFAETTGLGISRALCSAAAADSSRSLRSSVEWWGKMSMGFSAACAMGLTASFAVSTVAAEEATEVAVEEKAPEATTPPPPAVQKTVVFVLGGPGSGKGTQCAKLIEDYEIAHFSAGDLLRAHVNSGSADGNMVAEMIKEGKIVPAEVTVGLLKKAVEESGVDVVLIDGFPRSIDNRECFERVFGYDAHLVLFFDCPEEVLEKRLLGRNQGRVDDNIETIKKRFKVFVDQSLPVIEYYEKLGKVKRIDTNRPVQEIYEEVLSIFAP